MKLLKTIMNEAVGMFVDDSMLALLCVGLIAAVAVAVFVLSLPGLLGGTILLAGCVAILAWSVVRATRAAPHYRNR